jgi:hypothetical protein
MPMKSRAQEKFLWANHPEIAKWFEAHTPKNAKLPEHVKKDKPKKKSEKKK